MQATEWRVSKISESDYQYRIVRGVPDILLIHDLNKGRKTITNNAKAVVEEILKELERETLPFPVIYRDSFGAYDGIRIVDGTPAIFNLVAGKATYSEEDAIEAGRKIYMDSLKYYVCICQDCHKILKPLTPYRVPIADVMVLRVPSEKCDNHLKPIEYVRTMMTRNRLYLQCKGLIR